MANKLVSKSVKLDSSTNKMLQELVAKSGATQSDVMRHLIAEATAKELASNIQQMANESDSIAVDFATGNLKKNFK